MVGKGIAQARPGRRRHNCGRRGARRDDFAGVQNVLTKSIGTTNPHNVIKATFDALKKLKNRKRSPRFGASRFRNCNREQ